MWPVLYCLPNCTTTNSLLPNSCSFYSPVTNCCASKFRVPYRQLFSTCHTTDLSVVRPCPIKFFLTTLTVVGPIIGSQVHNCYMKTVHGIARILNTLNIRDIMISGLVLTLCKHKRTGHESSFVVISTSLRLVQNGLNCCKG